MILLWELHFSILVNIFYYSYLWFRRFILFLSEFIVAGVDAEGKIVCHSNQVIVHVSGRSILDNHSVNLISTVIMGLLMPTISKSLWPLF